MTLDIALTCFLLFASLLHPTMGTQPARERKPAVDPAIAQLVALESLLDEIEATSAYKPLFVSEHPDIARMQAAFGIVQRTVHDARRAREGDEPFPEGGADTLHCALREYCLNIDALETNAAFGETKTPNAGAKKKLIKALDAVRELANAIPGLEEASKVAPSSRASPQDAVVYAQRSLTQVYWLLDWRTLTYATSQGRAASKALREAVDEVWAVLDESIDEDGGLVIRTDGDGKPLADQLAPFKAAMREARKQAEFFRKTYIPNVRRDAQLVRARLIEELLGESGFEKVFLSVKALKDAPAGEG